MRRPVPRSCLIALTVLATAGAVFPGAAQAAGAAQATGAKTGCTSATFTEKVS